MDEREFIAAKRAQWNRLAVLIRKAERTGRAGRFSPDELKEFSSLYRRASSDLGRVRAQESGSDVVTHLNTLVGQAHALLYRSARSDRPLESIGNFYMYVFPALLQKRVAYFLAALVISIAGGIFAYWLVMTHPTRLDLFVPPGFQSSVQHWKTGKVSSEGSAEMSSFLMTHNLMVGLMAFAAGVFACWPTVVMLFTNGAMLGALSALMTQVHRQGTFWPGILPHGIAELTAIFICGGAGLQVGVALLAPGRLRRTDALMAAGKDAIQLVLGTIPLFIFAGIVEGMFSHLPIPAAVRLTFAGLNGLFWYAYLFVPRRPPSAHESGGTGTQPVLGA